MIGALFSEKELFMYLTGYNHSSLPATNETETSFQSIEYVIAENNSNLALHSDPESGEC